jgi:hypothetical protein
MGELFHGPEAQRENAFGRRSIGLGCRSEENAASVTLALIGVNVSRSAVWSSHCEVLR